MAKRAFDLGLALLLLVPGVPVMGAVWLAVVLSDGRPALYRSARMQAPGRPFALYKFRTMALAEGAEIGVSGGDKSHRITRLGRFLRRSRLDELPQLINILRGEMSFVGPRPPAPLYVDRFPALYAEVLRCKPGITGLATVMFHAREEFLLRDTATPEQTDAVYMRRCVPRKAHLDLIYRRRQTLGLDLYVLYLTFAKMLPLSGGRVGRLRARARRV